MYIPLIQGALCYAFKVGGLGEGEKSQAEAAVFAASVLPHVHAVNEVAGEIIYKNMKVGATSVSFDHVKAAFESVYSDMGISCADVGGLWNDATGTYYEGMEPCDAQNDMRCSNFSSSIENQGWKYWPGRFGCHRRHKSVPP